MGREGGFFAGGGDLAEAWLTFRLCAAFFRGTRAVLASCRWRFGRCNTITVLSTEGGGSIADGPGVGVGAGDGAGAGTGSEASLVLLRSVNAAQQWEGGGHIPRIYHTQTKSPTVMIYCGYVARRP